MSEARTGVLARRLRFNVFNAAFADLLEQLLDLGSETARIMWHERGQKIGELGVQEIGKFTPEQVDRITAPTPDLIQACQTGVTMLSGARFSLSEDKMKWWKVWSDNFEIQCRRHVDTVLLDVKKEHIKPPKTVPATLEWRDGEYAICRFEHPQKEKYGMVEREFRFDPWPEGLKAGAKLTIEIDVDESGRPVEYRPVLPAPKPSKESKAGPELDELGLSKPVFPDDAGDPKAMLAYERELAAYSQARFAVIEAQRGSSKY